MAGKKTVVKSATKTLSNAERQKRYREKNQPVKKQVKEKKETEKTDGEPKKMLVSTQKLAEFIGISERQLRNLQRAGIIEPEKQSKSGNEWDFVRCMYKVVRHYRESGGSKEMSDEKLRREAAKRKLDEMKVKLMEGESHHSNDLKHILGGMFTRLHTGLDSLPLGVAPLLTNEPDAMVIAGKIKDQLNRILYEILNFDYEIFLKSDKTGYLDSLEQMDKEEEEAE